MISTRACMAKALSMALLGVACSCPARISFATLSGSEGTQGSLRIWAKAINTRPAFRQYVYSFPLASPATLDSLTGFVSIISEGQGFAEALVSVDDDSSGNTCAISGESFGSYAEIRSHFPGLRTLARFIVKEPLGSRVSSVPTNVRFPKPVPIRGCLVVILDGAVLRVGGPFTMSSNIVVHLDSSSSASASASFLDLDDEFCFDRESGCQLSTLAVSPDMAFIKVVPIRRSAVLLALYGDISDSAFGWGGAKAPAGRWSIDNSYYLYHNCYLTEGIHGPDDYFARIPANAIKLFSSTMTGMGQRALQRFVYRTFHDMALSAGDCLVHLVRMTDTGELGGVDAESQVMALLEETGN